MALHAAAAALASTGGSSSAITNGTSVLLELVKTLLAAVVADPILVVYFVAGMIPIALGVLSGLKRL